MKADGGPLHPGEWVNDGDYNASAPDGTVVPPGGRIVVPGISVRAWFAGLAMQGLMTGVQQEWDYHAGEWRTPESKKAAAFRAQCAWEQADAMIEEMSK